MIKIKPRAVVTKACIVAELALAEPAGAGSIIYVDDDAATGGDGLSWATPYKYLQDALSEAAGEPGVTQIRVAAGTHYPDLDERGQLSPGDRTATFQLRNNLTISGGYRGCVGGNCGRGDPDERDINLYESILNGDVNGDDSGPPDDLSHADNSYHVVTVSGGDSRAILDGFTIAGGNANGPSPHNHGGGMLSTGSGSPTVTHCTFRGNAADAGGGMYNDGGSATLTNCTFSGNVASFGGGVLNNGSTASFDNCILSHNTAGSIGGGMYNFSSNSTLTNCTFQKNSAANGGGIFNQDSEPILTNCVLWGDSPDAILSGATSTATVTFSCVQDAAPGDGVVYPGQRNIDDDPLFAPGPLGCLYLGQTASGKPMDSPCVDAGSDAAAVLGLDGLTTRSDEAVDAGVVDMGYHYPVSGRPLAMGDFDRSGEVDLVDAGALLICFSGIGPTELSPCCRIFDFEPDHDVDLADYAVFAVLLRERLTIFPSVASSLGPRSGPTSLLFPKSLRVVVRNLR